MLNKKVGILTFHRAFNFGAVLQAYSLFYYLRDLGCDVEIIDFLPMMNWKDTAIFVTPKNRSTVIRDIYSAINYSYLRKRKKSFTEFVEKNIKLSRDRHFGADHLVEMIKNTGYDAVICGSDQIWNADLPDSDISFLLPDVKGVKKIAYAASMGKGRLEDFGDADLVKQYILDFDHISVRESSTREKINDFLKNDVKIDFAVDPTLLVDSSVLKKTASKKKLGEPYIFLYTVVGRKDTIEAAEILSKRVGMPVYTLLSGRPKKWWLKFRNKILSEDVGPSGFLAMVRDADFIVTDSFHGAVLSLIYHKNSFFIKKKENGAYVRDERIAEICDSFEINDRYIEKEMISEIPLTFNVDWVTIEEKRNQMSTNSKEFLKKALDS